MTQIGTHLASSLAPVAHQAQQVARQRDRAQASTQRDATRLHDLFETHLRGLEEADEVESGAQLKINSESQGSGHQQQEGDSNGRGESSQPADTQDSATPPTAPVAPSSETDSLYRHLDVQA